MKKSWNPSHFSDAGGSIKDGDAIGMSFDLGVIDHPEYGSATNLSGLIPLLIPQGEFPVPKILYDEPRLSKYVKDLVLKWRFLWENDLDDDIEERIRDFVLFTIMGDPEWDDLTHHRMHLRIIGIVGGFLADDIVDYMDESDLAGIGMDYKDTQGSTIVTKFFCGTGYEKPEEIPTFCPELSKFSTLWQEFMRGLTDNVENFSGERGDPFRDVTVKSFQAFMLIRGCNNDQSKDKSLSEDTLTDLNGWTTAFLQIHEFAMAVILPQDVPKEIRQDVLFERYRICIGNCSALMNAVFGLVRDVKTNQVNDSPILRQVVYKGVCLQTAFDITFQRLLGNMNDLRFGSELLLARYGHVAELKTYVHFAKIITDGQYYTYLHVKRYGSTNLKIQKIK